MDELSSNIAKLKCLTSFPSKYHSLVMPFGNVKEHTLASKCLQDFILARCVCKNEIQSKGHFISTKEKGPGHLKFVFEYRTSPQSTESLDTLPMPGFSAPKVEALGFYKALVPLNQIIMHHNP
jgi:hypothetical protein